MKKTKTPKTTPKRYLTARAVAFRADPSDPEHGTLNGFLVYGCRCQLGETGGCGPVGRRILTARIAVGRQALAANRAARKAGLQVNSALERANRNNIRNFRAEVTDEVKALLGAEQ